MRKVDIRRSEYFLKLSKTLNFSAAAKELGVSQPGLTKAINQLELDLGVKLIRREGRNTHLTPAGKALISHIEKLISIAEIVELTAEKIVRGDMPLLRLGIMCTIATPLIAQFLSQFRKTHSSVEITVKTLTASQIPDLTLSGEIDLVFIGSHLTNSIQKFRYKELYKERMVVASPLDHSFATKTAVSFMEIAEEYYIDRLQCEFRDTFLQEIIKKSFSPEYAVRCESEELALSLVAAGAGVTILPELLVNNQQNLVSMLWSKPLVFRRDDFSAKVK